MGTTTSHRRQNPPAQVRSEVLARQYEERRRNQAEALAQLDCLRAVPTTQLLRLAHLCTFRAFLAGTVITNERAPGDFLYLILRGSVTMTLHNRMGHEALIGVLNRGDCFSEGALFGDLFRGATVHAETNCYLLQLPCEDVRQIMADSPELTSALRTIYRQRLVEGTLGRVPLFSQLSSVERAGVAALLQPRRYERGETIIREGSPGKALYLVEAGQVVVEQNGRVIAHLDEGDFFGEMSLLRRQPHNADVRALTPVEILALPAVDLMRLLEQQPALATQFEAIVERRRAAGVALRQDQAQAEQLSAIVERGLMRGTHLLVRDPALCDPNCHICEDACATRHGQKRIHLGGVTIDGLDVTDSCRQCRVGAECVEACPHDAIHWDEHGALTITDNCTGCGKCVPACPYDAMRLAPLGGLDTPSLQLLWQRLKQLKNPTIPLTEERQTHRADKCDLCHGYDDLACVSACPHGALQLVPVEEVISL